MASFGLVSTESSRRSEDAGQKEDKVERQFTNMVDSSYVGLFLYQIYLNE